MPIPISYSYRNLLARRLTTFLTAAGMALVVFVFAAVLMLSEGLRRTLVATGSFDNVVVLRAGSESEVQSAIDRNQAGIIGAQPEIALGKEGRRFSQAVLLLEHIHCPVGVFYRLLLGYDAYTIIVCQHPVAWAYAHAADANRYVDLAESLRLSGCGGHVACEQREIQFSDVTSVSGCSTDDHPGHSLLNG